jgi:hypothetical protein
VRYSLTILLSFLSIIVFATEQLPDRVFFCGRPYTIETYPLESYFIKHPQNKPKVGIKSSGLFRRYVATYEIKKNEFFIRDIEVLIMIDYPLLSLKSVYLDVFKINKEIKMDWVTGLLVLRPDIRKDLLDINVPSDSEPFIVLEIENGNVKKVREFNKEDFDIFQEREMQAFKQTAEYKKVKSSFPKDKLSESEIDAIIKTRIERYFLKIVDK